VKDFIEQRIINAVRELLTGQVNTILSGMEFAIPIIEFGEYSAGYVVPVITLAACERTEKERVIRLDAYSVAITFSLPETPENELYCYAYSGAVDRAVYNDPTLGGAVDRAVITGKRYIPPKVAKCGEGWGLSIVLRLTAENEQ
jgi:hypothetical protein